MYFYLRGTIVLHQKGSIVIECNGVGYEVFVSHPEDYEIGEYMLVYTSFYVREDEQFLVGFKSFEEKMIFNKLIQVKGVGPKTALQALGSTTPKKLIDAINREDMLFLKKLNGIGPKAANQIILDLRNKITLQSSVTGDKELDDAIDGLKSFGFTKSEIDNAISKIDDRGLTCEQYIKKALTFLSKGN